MVPNLNHHEGKLLQHYFCCETPSATTPMLQKSKDEKKTAIQLVVPNPCPRDEKILQRHSCCISPSATSPMLQKKLDKKNSAIQPFCKSFCNKASVAKEFRNTTFITIMKTAIDRWSNDYRGKKIRRPTRSRPLHSLLDQGFYQETLIRLRKSWIHLNLNIETIVCLCVSNSAYTPSLLLNLTAAGTTHLKTLLLFQPLSTTCLLLKRRKKAG